MEIVDPTQRTSVVQPAPGRWRFADCEFDELRRELRVRGAAVSIEAKPLEVLHQLLLHAGEVVTKEELLECVWPGIMVVDASLATAVSKLRRALGSDSLVVTIPRVGYRLGVEVQRTAPSPPASPDLNVHAGDSVPGREQWRLSRRLDVGPSSEVWLAEHPKTREARVFKFASGDVQARYLKREVTLSRLLRESLGERPEYVRLLEWNFNRAPYFIESEYVGPNLAEWAEAQGGLAKVPLDVRVRLLADVARAVAAAHGLDILHKDLKPGNILISTRPDGTPQVKVGDFGSAALLAPGRLGALGITGLGFTQTGTSDAGSLTGTVLYVAPEVLAGRSPAPASDVYALGVLLYQLVAGDFRKPFAPGWEGDVADPLLRDDIAEAACGDPARRMTSAAELAERLQGLERRRRDLEERTRARARSHDRRQRARVWRRWLVGLSVAAVGTVIASLLISRDPKPTPGNSTVAVLPFQNVGSDPGLDHLRFALADEVSTVLSHARGLAVRPFSAARRFERPGLDLQQTARALGVSVVVTGHFLKADDQLQISVEAADADTNRVLWRDRVNAPTRSLIATQVQMALKIRGGLAPALGSTTADAVTRPKSEEAYDLFLRSAALTWDPAANPEGISMLEKAVALDPAYAPAWLALGRRYYSEARYASGNPAFIERHDAAMERVIGLDPGYVPAAAGLVVSRVERGDLTGAYQRAEDLVGRRPDSADAHFVMSYVLRFAGLLQESAQHCETAFLLDARTQTSGLRSCAILFFLLDDYPRALNYLHLDRGSDWARALTVHMLVRQGKHQDAVRIGAPRIPQWGSYDMLLACAQRRPEAEVDALAATVQPSEDPEANYLAASHLASCGRTEAALSLLKQAVKGKYCAYPAMDSDPYFESLRATPEFAEIRAAGIECQNEFVAWRDRRRP